MSQEKKLDKGKIGGGAATVASPKKVKNKVIADVHSGMVLVAPVTTPPDESTDQDAEGSTASNESKAPAGSLN